MDTAHRLFALVNADPNQPATLHDVALYCEAVTVANGIVAAAAVHAVGPGKAADFLAQLSDLAPRVGAADAVARHFIDRAIEGVDGFVRNS